MKEEKVRSQKMKKLLKQYKTRPALWYLKVATGKIADKSNVSSRENASAIQMCPVFR